MTLRLPILALALLCALYASVDAFAYQKPYYVYSKQTAQVPAECLPGNECPNANGDVTLCSIYTSGSCTRFCSDVVMGKMRTCSNRPSAATNNLIRQQCMSGCQHARQRLAATGPEANAGPAKALVLAAKAQGGYTGDVLMYRIWRYRRIQCYHYYDEHDRIVGGACGAYNGNACWICRRVGTHCPSECTSGTQNRWTFSL